jgi:hypothetical protein
MFRKFVNGKNMKTCAIFRITYDDAEKAIYDINTRTRFFPGEPCAKLMCSQKLTKPPNF